jgi:imidazolonepropionase-like amidohydrolase
LDGTGAPVRRDVRIRIQGNRIDSLEETGRPSAEERTGMLDLSGHVVLPALVDSHVHLFLSGTGTPGLRRHQMEADLDAASDWISSHIQAHLRWGIMAVRDGGDHRSLALQYRQRHSRRICPIQIRAAGRALHRKGRYGRFIGRSVAEWASLAEAIRNDGGRKDHVKIIQSGINSLTVFAKESRPQFSLQEMRDAVRAADEMGMGAMVHANGEEAVRIALQAGCRSLEHGYFMGEENLRRMAEAGIFWVPTAGAMSAYAEIAASGSIEAKVSALTLEHQLEQMSRARELGVPIAVGTDAGSPGVAHGAALLNELKLLIRAGFSTEDAVHCASQNGARLLQLPSTGTLCAGNRASLIAVPGDLEAFPDSLRDISLRIYDGLVWGNTVC